MIIQDARSKVKVTVTQKWYVTLCHSKMHPYTKFGIPASNNTGDCPGHNYSRNEVRVQGLCDPKMVSNTPPSHHPKMHQHTKCWIPTSNNTGDMYAPDTIILEMRSEVNVTPKRYAPLHHSMSHPHTKIWIHT